MSSHLLTIFSFALVVVNALSSIWKTLDRKILLLVNILLYIFIFIFVSDTDTFVWFEQQSFQYHGPYLARFSVISAITGLLFLEKKGKENIDGPLLISSFFVLNLSLLFSYDILRISLLLILFEILELLVLSNTKDFKRLMLKDLALTKLFSIITLLIGTIFIIVSKDSVSVFDSNIKNYDLYYLGVCFFIVYALSVIYIPPLEEVKRSALFNASNFTVICSILLKFVILGTVLASVLKTLIWDMEPNAQKEILFGLEVLMFFSMISLILKAVSNKNKGNIVYYLFCINNILALFSFYGTGEFEIGHIFVLLAISSLGLFAGIYIERNNNFFMKSKLKKIVFIFYLFVIMSLLGMPTTMIFQIRYLLIEQIFSLDTTLLLIIFMLISGLLWYPALIFLNERLKKTVNDEEDRGIGVLESVGFLWVFAQIVVLNYSSFLVSSFHE